MAKRPAHADTPPPPPPQRPELSVILPCYNEVGNLEPLIAELEETLTRIGRPFEVIYVDDCSSDGTTEKLRELTPQKHFLRHIRHRTNSGESAGTLTGFATARGDILITMDADMQNDPRDIPRLLAKLRTCDAVCGVRRNRRDTLGKRISSRLANAIRGAILGDGIHDAGCTFRAIRREAVVQPLPFRAYHRFLPTIMKLYGFRVREMYINDRPRTRGVSKYGFGNRFWVGVGDLFWLAWFGRRFLPPNRVESGTPRDSKENF